MGTPGHMQHPFDVPRVKTGQDLINYFKKIAGHLSANPGSVKFDGTNVSFKLVDDESTPTGKDFRMDRGTTYAGSVKGMTTEDAYEFWDEGHGMPPAIEELLKIFNEALPQLKPELKALGMWDDSTKFFNTEYMKKGKTNVIEYAEKILAIHGINQFYEKKAPKKWVESGKSMDRPGLERPDWHFQNDPETGKPFKKPGSIEVADYDKEALGRIIEKVKPIAEKYDISLVGDVPTELIADIDFTKTLERPFSIRTTEDETQTRTLEDWLLDAVNPWDAKVTKKAIIRNPETGAEEITSKEVPAIGKEVYVAIEVDKIPLNQFLLNPEQDVITAINGALFNHATLTLGMDVKRALGSSKGSLEGHEGVVLRGLEDRPLKVTGDFILKGRSGEIKKKISGEQETIKEEIIDAEKEYDIETVDMDTPEGKRKIALIPGGFKPPHRGHLSLVEHYLEEVAPDGRVILFMGSGGKQPRTINGNPITYEDALKIWNIYLNNENIAFPNEILDIVEVDGSPIGHALDYIKEADPEKEVIFLGAGTKDGKRWESMFEKPENNPNNVQIFIEPAPNYNDSEGKPMSATNFRNAIEAEYRDEKLIKSYIPEASHEFYEEIMDVLGGQLKESQHPLGIFLGLIEETIDEGRIKIQTPEERKKAEQWNNDTHAHWRNKNALLKAKKELLKLIRRASRLDRFGGLHRSEQGGTRQEKKRNQERVTLNRELKTTKKTIKLLKQKVKKVSKQLWFTCRRQNGKGKHYPECVDLWVDRYAPEDFQALWKDGLHVDYWNYWEKSTHGGKQNEGAERTILKYSGVVEEIKRYMLEQYTKGKNRERVLNAIIKHIGAPFLGEMAVKLGCTQSANAPRCVSEILYDQKYFPAIKTAIMNTTYSIVSGFDFRLHIHKKWPDLYQSKYISKGSCLYGIYSPTHKDLLIYPDVIKNCGSKPVKRTVLHEFEHAVRSEVKNRTGLDLLEIQQGIFKSITWPEQKRVDRPASGAARPASKGAHMHGHGHAHGDKENIQSAYKCGSGGPGSERYNYMSRRDIRARIKELQAFHKGEWTPRQVKRECNKSRRQKKCDIWAYFKCGNKDDIRNLTDHLNWVAKAKVPGPPTALAENFLNIIEETINETPVSDMTNMFGHASGLLEPITPGGFDDSAEEEATTAEEVVQKLIVAVEDAREEATSVDDVVQTLMDTILKAAEDHNIDIEDDEELEEISAGAAGAVEGFAGKRDNKKTRKSIIREVED